MKEHKVQTLIGFATSQPCALSNYTKDESAGESLVVSEILFDLNKKAEKTVLKRKNSKETWTKKTLNGFIYVRYNQIRLSTVGFRYVI